MKVVQVGPAHGGTKAYMFNLKNALKQCDEELDVKTYALPRDYMRKRVNPNDLRKEIAKREPDIIHVQTGETDTSQAAIPMSLYENVVVTFHGLQLRMLCPSLSERMIYNLERTARSLVWNYSSRLHFRLPEFTSEKWNKNLRVPLESRFLQEKGKSYNIFLEKLRHVFVLSNYSKKKLGLDATVVHHPPNFGVHEISEERKEQLNKKYGIKKPYVLADPGPPNWQKSYEVLPRCLEYIDSDLDILVVGQNIDMLHFRSNIKRGKASLRFYPSREEVPDDEMSHLFQGADALVQTYRLDTSFCQSGWTPVAAEHGTPVIHTGAGALPECVGDAGIQIELDPKDLAYAIDSIVMNDGLRSKLQQRALERSKLFTWDETARKTLEVYRSIVD